MIHKPTLTLGQMHAVLTELLAEHGPDVEVRVNTSYDQGCQAMAITEVWMTEYRADDPRASRKNDKYDLQPYIAIDA